jgi:hypothetical protein
MGNNRRQTDPATTWLGDDARCYFGIGVADGRVSR